MVFTDFRSLASKSGKVALVKFPVSSAGLCCEKQNNMVDWTGAGSAEGTATPGVLCRAGRPCTWWQKKKSEKHREFSLQVARSTPGIRWMPAPTILYRDQNKRKHVMVAVWYDLFDIIVLFRYMINYTRQAMHNQLKRFSDSMRCKLLGPWWVRVKQKEGSKN